MYAKKSNGALKNNWPTKKETVRPLLKKIKFNEKAMFCQKITKRLDP